MRSERMRLGLVLLVALAVRLAFLVLTSASEFLSIDGEDYQDIAANLAAGKGYSISFYRWFEPQPLNAPSTLHPDFYRPPLLPLIGAVLFELPGPWLLWARATVLLLGLLAVLLCFLIARECWSPRTALIAALVLALSPYAVWFSARWSTEMVMAVCLLAAVWLILRACSRPTGRAFLGIGILLGLATLARPNGLLLAIALPLVLLSRLLRHLRLRAAGLIALSFVLVVGPWSMRNARLTGVPNPVTFFGPYQMWLGMNPRIDEMYRAGASPRFNELHEALYRVDSAGHVRELERLGLFDPEAAGKYWLRQVAEFVGNHPWAAVRICAARCVHFLRPWPNPVTADAHIFWLSLLSVAPLALCALYALFRYPAVREPALYLPPLVGLAGSIPFDFSLRLRFPVFDPYLVLLAAPTVSLALLDLIAWAHRTKAFIGRLARSRP